MKNNDLNYFEDLIATGMTCPHPDAFEPNGEKIYFRVLKSKEVDSDSFLPTVLKGDKPIPKECDACIQKSVSIYDDLQGMLNGFFRLPSNKGKKKHIGILTLNAKDGMIKKTFGANHYSWWRSQAFAVEVVTAKEIEL